jgi:hypothetical protein
MRRLFDLAAMMASLLLCWLAEGRLVFSLYEVVLLVKLGEVPK